MTHLTAFHTLSARLLTPYTHCVAQVGVRVEEEELKTGIRHHCCSAYLTFVSVRARGGRNLPRVVPTVGVYQENYNAAER